jgi:DNA-binding Lrp family transcriptional regulator
MAEDRLDSSGISREEWLAAFNEVEAAPLPEDDAVSTLEFAKMMGISRAQAHRRLSMMLDAGKAERCTKTIRRVNMGIVQIPAFRLIKKPTKKR